MVFKKIIKEANYDIFGYSATTKARKEVLDTFIEVNEKYFANPNSLHKLGIEAKKLSDAATNQIAAYFKCKTRRNYLYKFF